MSAFNTRLSIFDRSVLKSEASLESAVLELFETIYFSTPDTFDSLLPQLIAEPDLLEFAISGPAPLEEKLLERFPTNSQEFATSPIARLLPRFKLYLHFLPFTYPKNTSDTLRDCTVAVEVTPRVLEVLATSSFDSSPIQDESDVEHDDVIPFMKVKRKGQKKAKKGRRVPRVNNKPFDDLNVPVPTSSLEAESLASDLLKDQKAILKFYISVLRDVEVVPSIKAQFLPPDEPIDAHPVPQTSDAKDQPAEQVEIAPEEAPPAYPMVQPMRAALYFESAEGFGEWRILISTRADRDLREARREDRHKFLIIIKKIKELSRGEFSEDNQKRLNGQTTDVSIFEAKMSRDLRLVYQVDCVPEYDSTVERQVIRIFGVYTHAQLDKRLWDSIGTQLGKKGKEYKQRCTFRSKRKNNDNNFSPASFPPLEENVDGPEPNRLELPREQLEEMHSLLVLEKFVTLSQALLNSIIADQEVAHVFAVSPQEKQVIEHQYSCFVLGRSGTGKTTTMLFKMLGIERAWEMYAVEVPKPRQLFVTQSRVLAEKVQEYFSKLLRSLGTASYSLEHLAKLAKDKKAEHEEADLVDRDDDANWRDDLPTRFSELEDKHFPLFITFDHLSRMLEADIDAALVLRAPVANDSSAYDRDADSLLMIHGAVKSLGQDHLGDRRSLLSYTSFLQSYWPHFPESLIKGLDPALVYSEFLGVIKGSEHALMHTQRFLDGISYKALSHRAQSTFSGQRDTIYTLFLTYMKRKKERKEYDNADRTHTILSHTLEQGRICRKIDYLYVDEAQDNLLIDALLLRSLCRNADGLFFAGDTAQTISVGSSFRCNDLKAFMYRIEERNMRGLTNTQVPPKTFQLAVNYRSHAGIVNCAHSIIQVITRFWPYAIDVLAQERGIIDGLKPVFLGGWDQDNVRYEQFLFGASGHPIEFGAQQCILVRDDNARDKLRAQVGDIGLILTLYESKGLEFNDVLLYNFFLDSTVDLSKWRLVQNMANDPFGHSMAVPDFDEARHASLCTELKSLYVAVTRARKNLWIIDSSEKSEPMKIFWSSKELIQIFTQGMDVPHLAVSSTPEEWTEAGRSLFRNKRYLQAKHCFERAHLPREVAVSNAYYLRDQARGIPVGPRSSSIPRQTAFLAAANAFIGCAAEAKTQQATYFLIAADCYEAGDDEIRAAKACEDGRDFNRAARLYRKLGMFDDAVRIVKLHQGLMDSFVVENILGIARVVYFQQNRIEDTIELFRSYEECLDFTELYDFGIARATVLQKMGRVEEAADLHLSEGRTVDAVQVLLKDNEAGRYLQRAVAVLLQGLWQRISFGATFGAVKADQTVGALLDISATSLNLAHLQSADGDELSMFHAIVAKDLNKLHNLSEGFLRAQDRKYAALMCLDLVFENSPRLLTGTMLEISTQLRSFQIYIDLVRGLVSLPDMYRVSSIQKLFGFQGSDDQGFVVRTSGFLYTFLSLHASLLRSDDDGLWVSGTELSRVLKEALVERVRLRVLAEDDLCQRSPVFRPCLSFISSGSCNRLACPLEHPPLTQLTVERYNLRVNMHLQQIMVLHSMHSVDKVSNWQSDVRYWLDRLHGAIHPPVYLLGNHTHFNRDTIPHEALRTVVSWIQYVVYSFPVRSPQDKRLFLTTVLQAAAIGSVIDPHTTSQYVDRAQHIVSAPDPQLVRMAGMESLGYVINELVKLLRGTEPSCLWGGVLSLRHIIENQLSINVNVLCDLIDHLCGLVVLTISVQWRVLVHDVTLPRTWLLSLLSLPDDGVPKAISLRMVQMLIDVLLRLLEQIHRVTTADYLLFESRDLSYRGYAIARRTFVLRIRRAICLVGWNLNNRTIRDPIVQGINVLGRIDNKDPYFRYSGFRNWARLTEAMRQSFTVSPMDEFVCILHPNVRAPRQIAPVTPIVARSLEDVLVALRNGLPASQPSRLKAEAAPFVLSPEKAPISPSETKMFSTDPNVAEETEIDPTAMDEEVEINEPDNERDHLDVLIEPADMPAFDITQSTNMNTGPSETEVQAACVIQTAYRRILARRRAMAKTGMAAARIEVFKLFTRESQAMYWPHTYYRLLFLGPLPHAYLCLQEGLRRLLVNRTKATKRMKEEQHERLDEVMNELAGLSGLLKETRRLKAALEPHAESHRARDLSLLKSNILAVEELLHRCPAAVTHDLELDLKLSLKGIVATRQPRRNEKPTLNTDEEFEIGDM